MTVLLDDDEKKPEPTPEVEETVKSMESAVVKGDPILDKIMARISPPEVVSTKLKVMIYGPPGVGKTTFAAGAGKTLIIDIESGCRTLIGRDNVEVLEYTSVEQVEALIRYLREGHPNFKEVETVVFDSITSLQQRLIDQLLAKKSKATGIPQYKADWDIYGETTQRLKSLMLAFRDIDKNLILTAHSKDSIDDQTKLATISPDLTPKLASAVVGMFDIVGYMRMTGQGGRTMQVQPSKLVVAKSRVNLPKDIPNPTWDSINK